VVATTNIVQDSHPNSRLAKRRHGNTGQLCPV